MNPLDDRVTVVRGGGDIGTGAIWRLRRIGMLVIVLELERPLTVRRTVAFSTAVTEGSVEVDGITGERAASSSDAEAMARQGIVPVMVDPDVPSFSQPPSILVDARLAKRNIDTSIDQAPLVVALGPGFSAGIDCDAVIETKRGHDLGRVIWSGPAAPNTGIPGVIGGASTDRVVRAGVDGWVSWTVEIGDAVTKGQPIGSVDEVPLNANTSGVVRGLICEGPVTKGLKIADIDPRRDVAATRSISDKALAVGGGVLEAVLTPRSHSL